MSPTFATDLTHLRRYLPFGPVFSAAFSVVLARLPLKRS